MAKRKANTRTRRRVDAGTVVSFRLPAREMAVIRDLAELAGVPFDDVVRVILAQGITRERAAMLAGKAKP